MANKTKTSKSKPESAIKNPSRVLSSADQTPPPTPLTAKEKSVLEFVEHSLADSGVSPSYQEIKEHFGFASYNSVQNYLKQLISKGYIQIPSNQKRAIHILRPSTAVQTQLEEIRASSPRASLLPNRSEGGELISLPLLGRVAAGAPIEEFDHDEHIDVPPSMIRNPTKSFALKVKGTSMVDDGILDGDIILVQRQASAINGEIVVATVENESTVKRLFTNTDSNRKLVELRPANSTMKSMWYPPDRIHIQGVVVGLIRKF
jgi:repressor LexA